MIDIKERIGRFTSSNIWKLTIKGSRPMTEEELKEWKKNNPKSQKKNTEDGFGEPALTYIEEKKAERTFCRSVDLGATTNDLTWGKVMEHYCNEFHLGLEYRLCSNITDVHPKYKFWSGSKDAVTETKVSEIKCYQLKKFYKLSLNLLKLKEGLITLEQFKNDTKNKMNEIYWQVVSNAIINSKPIAEIIAFTPTESQLLQIREELEETNVLEKLGIDPWKARFIVEKNLSELSYLPDGIDYPNFVSYSFEIPAEDIIFLTKCVINAEKLLTDG